jgi:hypothetical protein
MVVAILALAFQSFAQSGEEIEQRDLLLRIAAALELREPPKVPALPVPLSTARVPDRADPRVYVSIIDEREGMFPQTPFLLHNQGGDVAHSVQINPIVLKQGSVTFDIVDSIGTNKENKVLPRSKEQTLFSRHDISQALAEEWGKR